MQFMLSSFRATVHGYLKKNSPDVDLQNLCNQLIWMAEALEKSQKEVQTLKTEMLAVKKFIGK